MGLKLNKQTITGEINKTGDGGHKLNKQSRVLGDLNKQRRERGTQARGNKPGHRGHKLNKRTITQVQKTKQGIGDKLNEQSRALGDLSKQTRALGGITVYEQSRALGDLSKQTRALGGIGIPTAFWPQAKPSVLFAAEQFLKPFKKGGWAHHEVGVMPPSGYYYWGT